MASAAEQLASNASLSQFSKATDLKRRLWFTLGALVVFRLLSYVPLPGIERTSICPLWRWTARNTIDRPIPLPRSLVVK